MVALTDAMDQILTAIEAHLQAQRDSALHQVRSVHLGDRARVGFELPALWILTQPLTVTPRHALQETWEMPVILTSVVKGEEPDQAARLAIELAALARSAVVYGLDRRLGLPFVHDVQSTSFIPARETQLDNRLLYAAGAVVTIRFAVLESPSG